MRKYLFTKLLLLLTFLFFLVVLFVFLQNDFWQDEIYTLVHFVFVPLHTTLTDYHSTNNHVLFSLLNHLVRSCLLYRSLSYVLLHPYLLRIVPVVISLLSIILLYRQATIEYGKRVAVICSSIWLTTFPLLCFAAQFRGYSLSVLLIALQYFYFIKVIKTNSVSLRQWLLLLLFTSLSLLCLPTNIYIEASYLLLCVILFFKPDLSIYFFDTSIQKGNLVKIVTAISMGCLLTSLYYRWMLQQQPANEFITTFHPFAVANLFQAFAIFYHFAGYRLYLCFAVAASAILYFIQFKKQMFGFAPFLLPAFLFFMPFVFFFIHGAIIIQRTFLSLLPFFVLFTGLSVEPLSCYKFYNQGVNLLLLLNLVCIVTTFITFVEKSKKNNVVENHQQDLVQHYYLVHFNELEASLLAKRLVESNHAALYLRDGFGQTGIDYYLKAFNVPFVLYNKSVDAPKQYIILTNLKKETEEDLRKRKIIFKKLLNADDQYNVFLCNPIHE